MDADVYKIAQMNSHAIWPLQSSAPLHKTAECLYKDSRSHFTISEGAEMVHS